MKHFLIFVLLALLLLNTVACSGNDPFAHSTELFFENFSKQNPNAVVESLDAYLYDNVYYYRVKFRDAATNTPLELVYYGDSINVYLNPNWQSFGDLLDDYAHFRVAEREGVHKAFSEEEIEKHLSNVR